MSAALSGTGSEMEQRVRRAMREYPKYVKDTADGDAATSIFTLGKNVGIQSLSESVAVGGIAMARGTDYTMGPEFGVTDYGANQIAFASAPGSGTANVVVTYRETPYPSEYIYDGLTAASNILYPKFYKMDSATFTCQSNVRDYNLTQVVDQPLLRGMFSQSNGTWKTLNARVQPYGANVDQLWVPYRAYSLEWSGPDPFMHLWRIRGVGDVMKLNIMRSFFPVLGPNTNVDVPGHLQELLVLYAAGALLAKTEPQRVRMDTANVLQATFANQPGAIPQMANDLMSRFWLLYNRLSSEPPTFEIQDIPLSFQIGYRQFS